MIFNSRPLTDTEIAEIIAHQERNATKPIKNNHIYLRETYNVSKSEMHSLLINAFHIPIEISTVACKQYFTRKWNNINVKYAVGEGLLSFQDKDYLVVYYQCTPYQFKKAQMVMCSFREAQDEFNLPAYVLIKILPTEGE